MEKFILTWTEFKNQIIALTMPINYRITQTGYEVFNLNRAILSICEVKEPADILDFETYYKSKCNKYVNPLSEDGKEFVRAESRPLNTTTVFVSKADNQVIGDGKALIWDFSTQEDLVTAPDGFKRKRIEFKFIDPIYVKEGTLYYFDTLKGSYCDMTIICPAGQYYLNNNSVPRLATVDTIIAHYVVRHPLCGSIPMGDELNTEACSSQIPSNYKFWIEITVPESDNISHGAASLEIYRSRTVVLP